MSYEMGAPTHFSTDEAVRTVSGGATHSGHRNQRWGLTSCFGDKGMDQGRANHPTLD